MSLSKSILCGDINELRELVDLNDRLKHLTKNGIKMPIISIVLLGERFHGKTSTIESLTNLKLSSGVGMRTRCPTEIRLRNGPEDKFMLTYTRKGETEPKTLEFQENEMEIKLREVQTSVIGNEIDLAEGLIIITIEKPDLLPLTFIDLPGHICNSFVYSSQDVKIMLKRIYMKYLDNENNILLCIIDAATDIEKGEVFKMCREADPQGLRTMICMTKLDLKQEVDYDSYMKAAERCKIRNLFFVRNKTEIEKKEGKNFEYVRQKEKEFLENHSELLKFPTEMKGIRSLRDCLIEKQKATIISCIRENYFKALTNKANLEEEDRAIGQSIENEDEAAKYIAEGLAGVFKEITDMLYNNQIYKIDRNSYIKEHLKEDVGHYEVIFHSKGIILEYSIANAVDGKDVILRSEEKVSLTIKLSNDEGLNEISIIDLDKSFTIRVRTNSFFFLEISLNNGNDFVIFNERISKVNASIDKICKLDHFVTEDFPAIFDKHKNSINTFYNLLGSTHDSIAEIIIRKEYLPKFKMIVDTFMDYSEKFHKELYLDRVKRKFRYYPVLVRNIQELVFAYLEPKFKEVRSILEIFFQSLYYIATTDRQYQFKVNELVTLFEKFDDNKINRFIEIVCPETDFEALSEIYRANPEVHKTSIRVWSYLSIMCSVIKDFLEKTVKNHLRRESINNLEKVLTIKLTMEVLPKIGCRELMKTHEQLNKRRKEVKQDLKTTHELIKTISRFKDHPRLGSDFGFVDGYLFSEIDKLDNLTIISEMKD